MLRYDMYMAGACHGFCRDLNFIHKKNEVSNAMLCCLFCSICASKILGQIGSMTINGGEMKRSIHAPACAKKLVQWDYCSLLDWTFKL